MSSVTLPNQGLPQVSIPSPNKYTPDFWVNKPHPGFGFLEVQARDGIERGWLQFLPPQGFLIFGRDLGAAHVFVGHPSISNQHAVAAWDIRDGKCYILDLESEHGTFVNDQVIDHSVPNELRPGARVRFGQSAHIYIFNNLPDELVDPDQEAPITDRNIAMDNITDPSQSRYDGRFPERHPGFDRPPPPFHDDLPSSDRDRHGPPPDMTIDRRPPQEIERRPPPRDMGRRIPPPDIDPRAPPPDMDRRPPPPRDMGRRPLPPDMDRRPLPPDMDRRPLPPDMDRRPLPPDMDRRPLPPDMDRRPPPRDVDRRPPPPRERDRRPLPPEERWSPRERRFDERRPEGQGRGSSPRYDDRGRYDGPPRTPPQHMGPGPRPPPRDGRSPRMGGRGSPRSRRGRSPQGRDYR